MKRSRKLIVGLGEVLWDRLPGGARLGGAPANFAYHAHALGGHGVIVSCVGADESGRDALSVLGRAGMETGSIYVHPAYPTGSVDVELDALGKAVYVIHENVAWDHIPFGENLDDLAAATDAVCVGSLAQRTEESRETIRSFLEATRPACLRVFDLNLRQKYFNRDVIESTLEQSSVLKLNDEEWPVLAGMLGVDSVIEVGVRALMSRFGVMLVALTYGPEGSVLFTPTGCDRRGADPADVVDTVGAGDSFTAALVMGLLEGLPLGKIHERCAKVSAFVCSQAGAMPEYPQGFLS
jgi:fructokinase